MSFFEALISRGHSIGPKPCLSARRSQESLAVSSFLDLKEALGGPLDVVSLGKYPIEFDDYPAQTSILLLVGILAGSFTSFFLGSTIPGGWFLEMTSKCGGQPHDVTSMIAMTWLTWYAIHDNQCFSGGLWNHGRFQWQSIIKSNKTSFPGISTGITTGISPNAGGWCGQE